MNKHTHSISRPSIRPLQIFLFLAPLCSGLFYEPLAAIASIFLAVYILYCIQRNGHFVLAKSSMLLAVGVIAFFYAISAVWAVDHGMAIFGFIKILPVLLFMIALAQIDPVCHQHLKAVIPYAACTAVVLSFILGLIPALRNVIWIKNRFSGLFGYSNSFALFLLIAVIILLTSDEKKVFRWIGCGILLFGLFLTGSRTVFVLLFLSMGALFLIAKKSGVKVLLFALLGAAGLAFGYYFLSQHWQSLPQYAGLSLSGATFRVRLLYYIDALPVILKHPFGLGYNGYASLQGTFETGDYVVQNVHNEFLQLLLDVGWVPFVVTIIALVRSFINKHDNKADILIALVILAHSSLDFSLHFPIIGCILALVLFNDREAVVVHRKATVSIVVSILSLITLYFGIVSALYYTGHYQEAVTLYPAHTRSYCNLLLSEDDMSEADMTADHILRLNPSVSQAYATKARAAYVRGEFACVIDYEEKALQLTPYHQKEYLQYIDMLYVGIQLYAQAGDERSASICREKLLAVPQMMQEALDRSSELARRSTKAPKLSLPKEYQQLVDALS